MRRTGVLLALLLGLGLIVPATTASATTLTFGASEDTWVDGLHPNTNNGSTTVVRADETGPRLGYFKFVVTGVPAGETVTSAKLTLHAVVATGVTWPTSPVNLYNVGNSWSEATMIYTNRPALGSLIGSQVIAADDSTVFDVPVTGNGTYSFAIARTVTDTDHAYGSSEHDKVAKRPQLVVTTGAANTAPSVNAGTDSTVTLPATAALDGTVSDDGLPAGSSVTTTWSKVSGPGTVSFGNPSAVDTTAAFSTAGSYVLRLTASDGALSASDDVQITVSAATVNYPADANLIFLAQAPYNVVCDGVTDNTTAIQTAMNDYSDTEAEGPNSTDQSFTEKGAPRTLILPSGTCLFSDTLHPPGSSVRLVGAGETNTILKLKDNATGFGSAGTPKNAVWPGHWMTVGSGNSGFANYISDLTISIGSGNPGAVGVQWDASNTGAMERVTVTAAANSGLQGIALLGSTGSAEVQDVTVDGFDTGIISDSTTVNDMVFTNVTLKNQRTVAIDNVAKSLIFENLTVTGTPKVLQSETTAAATLIVDGTLTGPGTGTAMSLVSGYLYARNVAATGWGNLITQGSTQRFVGKTAIAEWGSLDYRKGNTAVAWSETSPVVSLNLAHPLPPKNTNYDLTTWVKAAVTNLNTDDDGPAIQAAIDTGKKVVYLPWGDYTIKTPVIVRGNVEVLDFMGAKVQVANTGKISVGTSTAATVIVRNVSTSVDLEQNGPNQVVFDNVCGINGNAPNLLTGASATGDVWLDNFGGSSGMNITKPIHVYVRQNNREGHKATISGGATVWSLGDNVEAHEGKGPPYFTATNSTVEIIGGAFDNLDNTLDFVSTAAFAFTGSNVSVVLPGVLRDGASTPKYLTDTKNGTLVGSVNDTQVWTDPQPANNNTRIVLPLYVSP